MSFENDIPDWRTYKDGDYYMQSVPPYFWGEYEGLAQRVEDENCLELLRGLAAIVRYGLSYDTCYAALMNELYNIRIKIEKKVKAGDFPILMDSLTVFITKGGLSCDEINSYLEDYKIGYVCSNTGFVSTTVHWELRDKGNKEYEEESFLIPVPSYKNDKERLMADLASAQSVLNDLIEISNELCNNAKYNQNTPENQTNDFYRSMLRMKDYVQVSDQTRHGISSSGKDAGSVDLLLWKNNKEIAIIEALKLECLNRLYIDEHIHKAIINYNALGTPTFLLVYMDSSDFNNLWNKFNEYIQDYNFGLDVIQKVSTQVAPNAALRLSECVLSRDGYDFPVKFLAVNMYKLNASI